jgi:hypothetical protein
MKQHFFVVSLLLCEDHGNANVLILQNVILPMIGPRVRLGIARAQTYRYLILKPTDFPCFSEHPNNWRSFWYRNISKHMSYVSQLLSMILSQDKESLRAGCCASVTLAITLIQRVQR